jgi:outer membrane protein assembly factor BamB
MSLNMIKIRFISIFIISLLLINTFLSVNVYADWDKKDNEGIWIDEFNNDDDIILNNCVLENGIIKLEEGTPEYSYDYKKKPNNVAASYHYRTFVPEGIIWEIISLYVKPDLNLGNPVEDDKMDNISLLDGITLHTQSWLLDDLNPNSYVYPPMHQFRFRIEQELEDVEKITIKWWFGEFVENINLKSITMYVWSYGDTFEKWDNPQKINYEPVNIDRGDPDNPLPDITFPTFGRDEYISTEGYIDILIVGEPNERGIESNIFTDYINISVTTNFGYKSLGYVQSEIIEPPNFGGWESVFWNSSKYFDSTGVTLKILNENGDEITGYSSTSSPFDISDIEEDQIILKAELHSNELGSTPELKSWGIIWQNITGYLDSFSNEYRIDDSIGLNIDTSNGEISVSDFYSDWEIFGKNPANTRTYAGEGIGDIKESDDYYWYTDINKGGGGFQTPVYSDGKVYVPSTNNSILVYNATRDSLIRQQPWRSSEPIYDVDTSIAVYNDYLIIATGTKGQNNKIYCLYKSDFTKKWEYPKTGNLKICYYAPPVIDDGVVYLTSWTGGFFDTPNIPLFNNFISGKNNLIALDIETGTLIWEPIALPEGSFSPPAIGEGNIYVGCQNMKGKSIFAFDTGTGNQIWNNSIGIIGRSGIVYGDRIVFAITNQKSSFFQKGINKIIALDANDGSEVWNKTIASFKSIRLLNMFKGLPFFESMSEAYAPIATPAYSNGTLFILDPNGTFYALNSENGNEKWKYSLTGLVEIFNHYHTSPVVVGNTVYVVTGNGRIYAFKTEYTSSSIEPLWTYQIKSPVQAVFELYRPNILASPIVADSLLFVSSTDDRRNFTGRLFCIGDYSPNTKGFVTSKTIHVPTGQWWNSFIADKQNSSSNTIIFSILNEKGDLLKTLSNYKENFNDISDINSNGIKLHARFEITNDSENFPVLYSWAVNWSEEDAAPEFDNSSFLPSGQGWINEEIEECSIVAIDNIDLDSGIKSGIDVTSGRYKIAYKSSSTGSAIYSDWIATESNYESGVDEARIIANLSALSFNIHTIVNITFKIKDLSGNSATSKVFTFRLDVDKPISEIQDRNSYNSEYNEEVPIVASANDPGDVNVSGIDFVSLLYKYRSSTDEEWSEDWELYDTREPDNYSWSFGHISIDSGYYKLITQAQDIAGNQEDIDDEKSITFLYDNQNPTLDTVFESEYIAEFIPTFTLSISDDFLLESLEFRVAGDPTWSIIADAEDIDGNTYTTEWTVPEDIWSTWNEGEEHYIFFRVLDKARNEFISGTNNSPKIIKNQSITDLFVDLSDFSDWQWDNIFSITANIPEYMDIKQISLFYGYSKDDEDIDYYTQYGKNLTNPPFEWEFTASNGSGYYSFYIRVEQTNGKVSTTRPETISVTLLPFTFSIILILISIIFIIVTLTVLLKMKKKKFEY